MGLLLGIGCGLINPNIFDTDIHLQKQVYSHDFGSATGLKVWSKYARRGRYAESKSTIAFDEWTRTLRFFLPGELAQVSADAGTMDLIARAAPADPRLNRPDRNVVPGRPDFKGGGGWSGAPLGPQSLDDFRKGLREPGVDYHGSPTSGSSPAKPARPGDLPDLTGDLGGDLGNLGKDPEVRYAPSGDAFANVTMATTRTWKDKTSGEKKEETEWHRIVFNGRLAEIAGEYLKKGRSIYVEGRLRTRKWQDKDGADKYTTEIYADQMQMLGSREGLGGGDEGGGGRAPGAGAGSAGGSAKPAPAKKPAGGFDDMDDDIPF